MALALAIHGGAGTILRSQMTVELEREYRVALENALKTGYSILESGGSSLDAVEASVIVLEDFPLFNAGRGSVFTHEGEQEMDASIMDGSNLRAGAVAFVKNIRNPIRLARLVMERTEHVLLAGEGANQFAEQLGIETEPDEYFFTEHRWLQLQEAIAEGRIQLDHFTAETQRRGDDTAGAEGARKNSPPYEGGVAAGSGRQGPASAKAAADGMVLPATPPHKPIGTVGAVACDQNGHLAAATSTGGMTNKKFGRVGDTPIIGAGNYADETVAVSCTGHGEYFMLGVTAYDVAARMKYKGLSLENAARETIDRLTQIQGEGGLIAVDRDGNITLPFNSEGMYRGAKTGIGESVISIYA